jgi:peptide/nickel transport system substrate-binding protein
LANVDEDISVILKRHDKYYKKDQYDNQLPFLDEIEIQFIKDKTTELFQFKQGNLDMMYRLPTDYIIEILDETRTDANGGYSKYELQRVPEMQTQLFAFLTNGDSKEKNPFVDIYVRKAFSFAIDRETILEFVLNGEGYAPGLHGITPPAFRQTYDISKVKGYTFNIDSARYYLNKAGYPNGKGFPKITLDFNSEGLRHHNVAVEVQKQLKKNLNIDINIVIHPHAQITEKCLTGNYNFIRLSWVADFPSPQTFLWMFHSKNMPDKLGEKSYPNITRYKNAKFDELYEKAMTAANEQEAMRYFMEAENVVMRDAPVLVLWYDECYRLLQSRVKNFPTNPMQFRDFSEVYVAPEEGATTEQATPETKK